MKKIISVLYLLVAALLLTGCAGVSGDFECNATTSDSCMTMEQANQKARQRTGDVKGKPAAVALPALVSLPLQAVNPAPAKTYGLPSRLSLVSPTLPTKVPSSMSMAPRTVVTPLTVPSCLAGRCDSPGQSRVQRTAEQVAHVWVAPWVDTDDVFHQPGRVSFVMDAARWQLPQSVN